MPFHTPKEKAKKKKKIPKVRKGAPAATALGSGLAAKAAKGIRRGQQGAASVLQSIKNRRKSKKK
jgi:hypothetical protein